MCDPVSLGVATAGAKGFGAIANFQSGKQKADAANQASYNQYQQQMQLKGFQDQSRAAVYRQKLVDYKANLDSFKEAAYAGYRKEQERLNEVYSAARFTTQGQVAELLQKQGMLNASGIARGNSTRRAAANMVAQYGMNQAILAQNILGAHNRFDRGIEDINRQWKSAQNKAYSQVAVAPMFGPAPVAPTMVQGPSGMSLAAGLADAAVSGFGAYMGAKAPATEIPGGDSLDYAGGAMTDAFKPSATGLGDNLFKEMDIDWTQGFGVGN